MNQRNPFESRNFETGSQNPGKKENVVPINFEKFATKPNIEIGGTVENHQEKPKSGAEKRVESSISKPKEQTVKSQEKITKKELRTKLKRRQKEIKSNLYSTNIADYVLSQIPILGTAINWFRSKKFDPAELASNVAKARQEYQEAEAQLETL